MACPLPIGRHGWSAPSRGRGAKAEGQSGERECCERSCRKRAREKALEGPSGERELCVWSLKRVLKRRVEKRTLHERHERREAVELWVDALQGSRDSFPVSFSFGFMCKCLWEAPVGDTVESFKCCRVFAFIRIFFCIVFVAVHD